MNNRVRRLILCSLNMTKSAELQTKAKFKISIISKPDALFGHSHFFNLEMRLKPQAIPLCDAMAMVASTGLHPLTPRPVSHRPDTPTDHHLESPHPAHGCTPQAWQRQS